MSHLKFNPSHENVFKEASMLWRSEPDLYRPYSPSLMNGPLIITPESNWTLEHMFAFHMIPSLDLDLRHILHAEYVPSDMVKFNSLWRLHRDDIYDKNYEKLLHSDSPQDAGNQAQIIGCMVQLMHQLSPQLPLLHPCVRCSWKSSGCAIDIFLVGIIPIEQPIIFKYYLVSTGNVRADGVIVFAESRHNEQTAVWIEVKPLMYAPRNKSNYETTLPQEAAEAPAIVQSRGRQHEKEQEHAIFPAAYLSSIQTHKSLPPEQYVVLKQSKTLELVEVSGSFQFSQNMVGIMKYLSAGNAKIGNGAD
ncbi:hypothetical protein INT43_003607 [Umbelopsis isabellina]|uniref:Uncharacterized protein n=1 Tax=Mortierella isabellina TaxID=91625 RepID=A0A8H7PUP7_MORIS|nr:hypothetical protein INT43_003607 [Umbelopsis isabellina]